MNTLNILLVDNCITQYYQERINHGTDSGYDLYCPYDVIILPNCVGTLDFQIKCSPQFSNGVSGYYLYPR